MYVNIKTTIKLKGELNKTIILLYPVSNKHISKWSIKWEVNDVRWWSKIYIIQTDYYTEYETGLS